VLYLRDLAVADHHIGLTIQDWGYEVGDAGLGVLVIAIGVDDNIRPEPEASVKPTLKGGSQAFIAVVAHDMVHAKLARYLYSPVGRAVIDNERFEHIHTRYRAGHISEHKRQRLLFIVAGYLHDNFHAFFSPSMAGILLRTGMTVKQSEMRIDLRE
jgi:hypothetical protein